MNSLSNDRPGRLWQKRIGLCVIPDAVSNHGYRKIASVLCPPSRQRLLHYARGSSLLHKGALPASTKTSSSVLATSLLRDIDFFAQSRSRFCAAYQSKCSPSIFLKRFSTDWHTQLRRSVSVQADHGTCVSFVATRFTALQQNSGCRNPFAERTRSKGPVA